jgi:hypothetical protein
MEVNMTPIEEVIRFISSMREHVDRSVMAGMVLVASLAYDMTTTKFWELLRKGENKDEN